MSEIISKNKEIVTPGEILATGMDYLPSGSAFREGNNIISSRLGLVEINNRLIKVIPLTGRYIPKVNDQIIGKVSDIGLSGWRIDIGWAFDANVSLKDGSSEFIERGADLTKFYTFNDLVTGKIIKVNGSKIIDLTLKGPGLGKLSTGKLIEITPSKVPRVIGKAGSMISLIKEKTKCRIIVGQNGLVWLSGNTPENEDLATKAIYKIENESHLSGLTDNMSKFLEGK